MELKSISSLGRIEKRFNLLKDVSITLHTLSALDTQKCLAELPNSLSDASFRNIILQKALLVYSTSEINAPDYGYTGSVTLDQAKKFFDDIPPSLFNEAASYLDVLNNEQTSVLEELKKKV